MGEQRKITLPAGLVPRFLSREAAAAYLGVSVAVFDHEVQRGIWPQPFRRGEKLGRLTWDRIALDAAADATSGMAASRTGNTWDSM